MFWNKKTNTNGSQKANIQFSGKPSKKRKDTFIIRLNNLMADFNVFQLCRQTPMPVITLNGQEVNTPKNGFMTATPFPNPGANVMANAYRDAIWREIAGEKLATTIVQYRDKFTNEPVLVLYPTNHVSSLVDGQDWATVANTRLNHAARKDLWHQMNNVRLPKIIEYYRRVGNSH